MHLASFKGRSILTKEFLNEGSRMNFFKLAALSTSILALSACIDEGDDGQINNVFDFELTPVPADQRSHIILEGGAIEAKDLMFEIQRTIYDKGSISFVDERPTIDSIDNTINQQMRDWINSTNISGDIEVTATNITSTNPNVAAFENGKIVGKSPGKTSLTVTLDTSRPLAEVFDTTDIDFTGFQNTHEFGEITVCPYTDVEFSTNALAFSDLNTAADVVAISMENGNASDKLSMQPTFDYESLAQYGLTPEDCNNKIIEPAAENIDLLYAGYIHPVINQSIKPYDVFSYYNVGEITGVNLHGFSLPNITLSNISEFSNPRITDAGFDGQLVLDTANPITIMAASSELGRDVNITHYYINNDYYLYNNDQVLGFTIHSDNYCNNWGGVEYCIDSNDSTHAITLSKDGAPTVTSSELPVLTGTPSTSITPKTGLPGTTFKLTSKLLVGDKEYDTSAYIGGRGNLNRYKVSINEGQREPTSRYFTIDEIAKGEFNYVHEFSEPISYVTGPATTSDIQGRWVQVDTGEDHFIASHSNHTYTPIDANQLTFQDDSNNTAILVRAGIENVAVSGQVNVVEEAGAQALSFDSGSDFSVQSRSFSPQARSLAGIASIDLILKNVNTGDETEVAVAADGTFSEAVPTGIYDVDGTVVDGEITYAIDTQITVEKDSTDTGKLNLAKVGLYNFDLSITGCEYDYKCYAGSQYTFTITAKNTGFVASSAVEAVIADISSHANVSQFAIISTPITGAARGDSISYQFTATFSQPAEDTVIEVPITLSDASGRTWEDILKINLSQYNATSVEIHAHNDAAEAQVRGYLMLEGRTPIRVNGTFNSIKVPNKPGASYELILANQVYNQETPYAVSFATSTSDQQISNATGIIGKNENADDVVSGATELTPGESNIAYISAGDVDYYLINIPAAP